MRASIRTPPDVASVVFGNARRAVNRDDAARSEEHTSELQSQSNIVCRLLLEKKKIVEHSTNALQQASTVNGDISRFTLLDGGLPVLGTQAKEGLWVLDDRHQIVQITLIIAPM